MTLLPPPTRLCCLQVEAKVCAELASLGLLATPKNPKPRQVRANEATWSTFSVCLLPPPQPGACRSPSCSSDPPPPSVFLGHFLWPHSLPAMPPSPVWPTPTPSPVSQVEYEDLPKLTYLTAANKVGCGLGFRV